LIGCSTAAANAIDHKRGVPPPFPVGGNGMANGHGDMSAGEEQRLLEMLAGLGQFEAVYPLLHSLAQARRIALACRRSSWSGAGAGQEARRQERNGEQAEFLMLAACPPAR